MIVRPFLQTDLDPFENSQSCPAGIIWKTLLALAKIREYLPRLPLERKARTDVDDVATVAMSRDAAREKTACLRPLVTTKGRAEILGISDIQGAHGRMVYLSRDFVCSRRIVVRRRRFSGLRIVALFRGQLMEGFSAFPAVNGRRLIEDA